MVIPVLILKIIEMKPFPLKIILFAVLALCLISCHKDDDVKPVPVVNKITIGGDQYETIVIGTQTWTTVNYKGAGGLPDDNAGTKTNYGKFYTYAEAKAIVVPSGWRLPTLADYIKLGESQGIVFTNFNAFKQDLIKKLASTSDWLNINGNNHSGFNAYPAGYMFGTDPAIGGDISEFWTVDGTSFSIQESADNKNHNIRAYDNSASDQYRFNVRFVRDN